MLGKFLFLVHRPLTGEWHLANHLWATKSACTKTSIHLGNINYNNIRLLLLLLLLLLSLLLLNIFAFQQTVEMNSIEFP